MKKSLLLAVSVVFVAISAGPLAALDVDGKGSMKGAAVEQTESDGVAKGYTGNDELQSVMTDYITENSNEGIFTLTDPNSGVDRNLSFVELHAKVGMKDGKHFSCADFKDVDTDELIDVDIFVDVAGDEIQVSDAVIHKIDGKYADAGAEKGNDKGSPKGSY